MSKHLTNKYIRDYKKRVADQQTGNPSKQPRTDAERARCYRARTKAAKGKASPTIGWDAGEGPSTRGRRFKLIHMWRCVCRIKSTV